MPRSNPVRERSSKFAAASTFMNPSSSGDLSAKRWNSRRRSRSHSAGTPTMAVTRPCLSVEEMSSPVSSVR